MPSKEWAFSGEWYAKEGEKKKKERRVRTESRGKGYDGVRSIK